MRNPFLVPLAIALLLSGCAQRTTTPPTTAPTPTGGSSAATVAATPPPVEVADAPGLPTRFEPAAIDAYMAAQVKAREIVGASLVIVRDGETVLERNYGVASLETGAPVTSDTPFAIGSISKQFICVAALMLEQDRKLSLSDKVAKYYPDLTRARDITLDDLGGHLSGYPDFYPLDFVDRRMQTPIEPDEIIRRYATAELDFEPRTRYSYSNTGFIVLGRVIEKVSRQTLAEFLQKRVFARAGMQHASFDPKHGTPGLAAGHLTFALGKPEPVAREAEGWIHAAGGVYASARDVARWNLALVDGKVLNAKSMKKLATSRTLADGRSTDYGCGLGVRRSGGETVLSHTGAVSGFAAFSSVVPRTRSSVVLLVNTEGGTPGELHQQLLGLVLSGKATVPDVQGPPANDVGLALFRQMQRGELDRAALGEEFSAYIDDARLREAAPRLRALGEPKSVEIAERRERGGMEVASLRFVFGERTVKAMLYRTPDGKVQEFLLLHD